MVAPIPEHKFSRLVRFHGCVLRPTAKEYEIVTKEGQFVCSIAISHKKGGKRDDRSLENGRRPSPQNQREWQSGAEQNDAQLDVEFDAKPFVQPSGKADYIGNQETERQGHERRFDVVMLRFIPVARGNDRNRENIDQSERQNKCLRPLSNQRRGDSERRGESCKLRRVPPGVRGQLSGELGEG